MRRFTFESLGCGLGMGIAMLTTTMAGPWWLTAIEWALVIALLIMGVSGLVEARLAKRHG